MFFNFWHVLAWFLTNLKQRLDQGQLRPTNQGSQKSQIPSVNSSTHLLPTQLFVPSTQECGTTEFTSLGIFQTPSASGLDLQAGPCLLKKKLESCTYVEDFWIHKTRLFAIFGARLNQKCWFLHGFTNFLHYFPRTSRMQRAKHSLNNQLFPQHNKHNRSSRRAPCPDSIPAARIEESWSSCLELKARTCSQSMPIHIISHILWKYVRDWGSLNNCFTSKEHQSHP